MTVNDYERSTSRVRITANFAPELAAQLHQAKRPGESTSEALCRLVERGLLADATVTMAGQFKRSEERMESVGLAVIQEVKEIKLKMKELVSQINQLIKE